jgi:glucose dehydrogenase
VVFTPRATSYCALALIFVLSGSVASGQQPKKKEPPPPFALLPAEPAWQIALESSPSAGGAMDAEHVYVPLQSGVLVALDRETGAVQWQHDVETTWAPVVGDGAVYVAAANALEAIEPATGATRWRVPLGRPLLAPFTATGDLLIVVIEQGDIIALRSNDGREVWRQRANKDRPLSAPVPGDRSVYLTYDGGEVAAISVVDGQLLWQVTLPGRLSVPGIARDRVFVGSTNNYLYALDADDGEIEWKWRAGGDVIGTAGDAMDRIYFASLDNMLLALNRGNGNQRWRKSIDARPAIPPIVVNDIVLLTGVAPRLTSYSTRDGAVVGTYTAPEVLKDAPLIDPLLKPFRVALVVITRDGRVVGLKPTAMLFREPPLTPMQTLPGTHLGRETLPQ